MRTVNLSASQLELGTGESYAADLIIGADGEHSICRESLLGHGDPPLSSSDVIYPLAIPAYSVAAHLPAIIDPPCVHTWYGLNSHAVCYQLLKNGIFNIILTLPESEGAATIGSRPADLDAIRNQCKEWDPRFQQLLNLAESSLKWTLLQTKELETWTHHSGRFILVGDSAHATLPYLYFSPPQITNSEYQRRHLIEPKEQRSPLNPHTRSARFFKTLLNPRSSRRSSIYIHNCSFQAPVVRGNVVRTCTIYVSWSTGRPRGNAIGCFEKRSLERVFQILGQIPGFKIECRRMMLKRWRRERGRNSILKGAGVRAQGDPKL